MPIDTLSGQSSKDTVICVFILKKDLSGLKRVFLRRIDAAGTSKIPVKNLALFSPRQGAREEDFVKMVLGKCRLVEVDISTFNSSRIPGLENCIRDLRKKRN